MSLNNKMKLPAEPEFDQQTGETAQFQKNAYARELRAVGQALEEQHVFSLDLELKGGLYVVRGKVTAADYAHSSFSGFIQDLISGVRSALTGGPQPRSHQQKTTLLEIASYKGSAQKRFEGACTSPQCGPES
jgi:hypothetical protein